MEKKYLSELKLSEEFLEIAKLNLKVSVRSSANRLYFSFEKAIVSYLLFRKLKVLKNHKRVWVLCAEVLGEKYYNHLRNLYDLRMQGDYGNISQFVELNEKVLRNNIEITENMIKGLKEKMR